MRAYVDAFRAKGLLPGLYDSVWGSWPANGLMKTASFAPVAARDVRLEATAVSGASAAATELAVGARR